MEVEHGRAVRGVAFGLGPGENVPEAQRLVARAGDDRLPVRRHGEVEYAQRVTRERRHLVRVRVRVRVRARVRG